MILFASWYCGFLTLQKTSVFFWKLFSQHLKTESITCQEGRYEARRTIGFELYFLCDRRSYHQTAHLIPSVPCRRLLFPSYSPPILFSVNRPSIRLPPRISVKLEDSSPFPACLILLAESVNERIVDREVSFTNRLGISIKNVRRRPVASLYNKQ